MMRGLLNGFPHKRKASINRQRLPSCGPNVPHKKPYCIEPSAQHAEEANLGASGNCALNLGLSGNKHLNSSEFQQVVNNFVKSEQIKSELNESLDAWVGKVVTSTLKANGVDMSSIQVEKVLESIAQETSKQLLGVGTQAGVYESRTISEIGSTSDEIMFPDVAKQCYPPVGPTDNSTKAITDIGSTTEGKVSDNFISTEVKLPNRKVFLKREYPPFCGRLAPRPTEEERSRIISEFKKKGKVVVEYSAREVSSKTKKLEMDRGSKVIGVSAHEMFPKTKNLEKLGKPLKEPAESDLKNNPVRETVSTNEKNLVVQPKPLNSAKGSQNIDMREKVRHTLALFRAITEELSQQEKYIRRVDLQAAKIIRDSCKEVNSERQWIGSVPGVEVGDEFLYRAELMVVGVHRHPQGGIDYVKNGNLIVATSIIASGGYSDVMANSDVLIYSGQGGNITGRKNEPPKDQKMERGNLALKNCISTRTQVRVTRGFESKASSARARMVTYTYDGLYTVERFWSERGQHGKLVFMFELKRVPGHPELLGEVMR